MATEWQQNACSDSGSDALKSPVAEPNPSRWAYRQLSSDEVRQEATGRRSDPQVHLARKLADALLAEQQSAIIEKMVGAGIDLSRPSDNVMIDLVTLDLKKVEGCRACRFLPAVAKKERSDYLTSLEAFMSDPRMKSARYGVITMGTPVRAFNRHLRRMLIQFHRKISRWASLAKRRFGMEMIIRSTEFTRDSAEARGMFGQEPSYHFHTNVIYVPNAYDAENFSAFLAWTWEFFGSHWRDCGRVKDVREIVKYMVKPGDLDDACGQELVWLYLETQKLKIVQALGAFAGYRRSLKKVGLKIRGISSAAGVREIVFVKKDTRTPSSKQEKIARLEERESDLITDLERVEDDRLARQLLQRLRDCQFDLKALAEPPQNLILGVLPPAARNIHYATPAVMVAGFTVLEDLAKDPKFKMLRAQALRHWAANGAPDLDLARKELAAAKVDFEAQATAKKTENWKNRKNVIANPSRKRRQLDRSRSTRVPESKRGGSGRGSKLSEEFKTA